MDCSISVLQCEGMKSGNPAQFYLDKLGRFELLGIPQIDYEPIICNSNKEKLVPGLFEHNNSPIDTVHGTQDNDCGDENCLY